MKLPKLQYFDVVKQYFNGDPLKTWEWFKNHNATLCDSPLNLLRKSRHAVIKKHLDRCLRMGERI